MKAEQKGQRRAELQQQGKAPGQATALAQGQPVDASPLHRPGCGSPACIQAQGNGQAGEHHAQGQAGFHQQLHPRAQAPNQKPRQQQIEQAQAQGTKGRGKLDMTDQGELQAKAHQRRAEQHRGVDIIALARRPAQHVAPSFRRILGAHQLAPGKQQADGHVHQEEQQQKRLGAPQQLRGVGAQAPGKADAEGADKADQIEQTPGLEPGDGKDTGVEQGEVAEQRHMVATAGRGQDRRGKAAQGCRCGQAQGILLHRENGREDRHQYQQTQGKGRVEQGVQAHGGKHRQIQHRHPGALQHQGVAGVASAQPPA